MFTTKRQQANLDREYIDGWQEGYDAAMDTAAKNGLDPAYYQGIIMGQIATIGFPRPQASRALRERRGLAS